MTNYTVNNLASGNHSWNVTCWDNAMNINTSETRNLTIMTTEEAISISLSPRLGQQVNWTILSLPVVDLSADGNNNELETSFWINVSTFGGTADIYVKANSDLIDSGGDILGLKNETYSYNLTNSSVPSSSKFSLTTNYTDNKIGDSLTDGSVVYLKFFLNAPSSQPAGDYNNTLLFKAVINGQAP
jgi:hypothetical protein